MSMLHLQLHRLIKEKEKSIKMAFWKNGLSVLLGVMLASCQPSHDISSVSMSHSDMNTLRSPVEDWEEEPIKIRPKSRPFKTNPSPSLPKNFQKKVSIQINDSVPLKEAIQRVALQCGVDLQMDPSIQSRILFSAQDRSFYEVLQDICQLADLKLTVISNGIRIEPDTPYAATYNVQFLNLSRTTDNRISIATDVFASMKEQKSPMDNGSNSTVQAKGEASFWTELEQNLSIILGESESGTPNFTIHKQGGIISVRATSKQHKQIETYLKTLRQATTSQVLIEAKVIEVSLKDEFKSGINWQKLAYGALNFHMPLGTIAKRSKVLDPTSAQSDILSFGLDSKRFSGLIKAISEFGSVRTLSSPRVTVMNNQNAILKVAQNQVYFRLNYDKQYSLNVNRENVSVSSDIMTVPIGLVMAVQPSIEPETGQIILSLRPTISRLSKSVSDPAVDIAFNATTHRNATPIEHKPSLVPVVEVREIDSVLKVSDGGIAILGGLMETRSSQGEAKLPGAGDIPCLGDLFKATSRVEEVVELVILLKATIVEDGCLSEADQRLYENYTDDPRPLYN
jgi:general secretion pathway protein D